MTSSPVLLRPTDPTLRAALRVATLFGLAKLLLTFALTLYTIHIGYSYFRDEFYYVACGHHLALGYVDHGPIVALQARLGEALFGDSVFAMRIFSAVAIAASIFITGIIVWAMGGRRPAQALAMFSLAIAPQYIAQAGYLSMNSFEPLFWTTCVLALILILRGHSSRRWWIIFGLSAGIGLLNKPSMAFFLASIGFGLLLTRQRRLLLSRNAALGIALLLVIALPNVLWQAHNGWPTLEFLRDQQMYHKHINNLNPLQFFMQQFAMMHPLNVLLWVTGIVALLRARAIAHARWIACAYLIFFVLMDLLHAKDYYLAAAYPALFAAGAIAWERRFANVRRVRQDRIVAFPVLESILLLSALLLLPMTSPVLAPATWVRYTTALHLHQENLQTEGSGPLPQFFADRFGWQQETALILAAYQSLTPADRQRVCIFGNNYGEAASIDFFNRLQHANLPPAISGHNNYYFWGTHGCDVNLVIAVIGDLPADVATKYTSVTIAGHLNDPYAMPYEHKNIYILRGRRPGAPFLWSDEKHFD